VGLAGQIEPPRCAVLEAQDADELLEAGIIIIVSLMRMAGLCVQLQLVGSVRRVRGNGRRIRYSIVIKCDSHRPDGNWAEERRYSPIDNAAPGERNNSISGSDTQQGTPLWRLSDTLRQSFEANEC
jgi:hypothetical protein